MSEIQNKNRLTADSYLTGIRPLVIKLTEYLTANGFEEVSVLAVNSEGKRYAITRAGTNIADDSMSSDRGIVIRVSDSKMSAECSRSELREDSFEDIKNALQALMKETEKQNTKILPDNISGGANAAASKELPELKEYFTEYEINPVEQGDDAIIEHIEKVRLKALACDERVLDTRVMCTYCRRAELFVKGNKSGITEQKQQNVLWTTGAILVMAARGEEIKDYYKGYSTLGGTEIFSEMEEDVETLVKSAIDLLDSEPIPPGEYECVCTPDVTGMIVHEAFGHGVEMDMFVKKRALAEQYVGKYVASELVTMHDGAASALQTASYLFDDEGTDGTDTIVIEKGILKRGISDLRSAGRLGTEPTGNGRRESSRRKAYTRMTNTFFEAGTDKPEDMIASIKYGFLLENASSGMEDPKNWGIQCMVNVAREIKDGKLTGKIFSPIVLTGYVPDLLKSISMVSDKVELSGSGFCGKGYKEWVKVSDGGPYIKARIRLG